MPDENLLDEQPEAEAPPAENDAPEHEDGEGKQDEGEQTALLPKTFFAGKEPEVGQTGRFEITAVHSDEISVKLLDEEEGEAQPEKPAPAPGGMDSMLE
jgi:hypothetical protein